jgi:hypothetical protein
MMKPSLVRPNESTSNPEHESLEDKPKWMSHIEWFCMFTVLFSGYLWFSIPVMTAAQSYFRIGLITVGVMGYLLIQILKYGKSK